MVQKVGGLTQHEAQQLFKAFSGLGDVDDMVEKIKEVEGLRHPTFHALLRQEYLAVKRSDDPDLKEKLRALEVRYERFFAVLHKQFYLSRLGAAGIQSEGATSSRRVRREVGRLAAFVVCREDLIVAALTRLLEVTPIAELAEVLGVALGVTSGSIHLRSEAYPEMARQLFDPTASFAVELAPLLSAVSPELPSHSKSVYSIVEFWDPAAGVRFIAPQRTFLRVDPGDALEGLVQGSVDTLHPGIFPDHESGVPVGLLASDLETGGDALARAIQVLAIGSSVRVFVMPGFSGRDSSMERVIEVRASRLLELCEADLARRIPQVVKINTGATNLTVAYSRAELQSVLARLLQELQGDRAQARITGMVLLEEITHKVLEGGVELDVAIREVQERFHGLEADVPIHLSNDTGSDPRREMVSITLVEAVGQMRSGEFELKALLACQLANKCLLMGEHGRARAALSRVRTALDQVGSDAVTEHLWSMVHGFEAQLLLESGEAAGAVVSLERAIELTRPRAASFESRGIGGAAEALNFASSLNQLAGTQDHARRPAEALRTAAECRRYIQRITDFIESHADEFREEWERTYLANQTRYLLGGVLANEGAHMMSAAQVLEQIAEAVPDLTFGDLVSLTAESTAFPDEAQSVFRLLASDLLSSVPRAVTVDEARDFTLRLAYRRIKDALAISVELKGWNYGSIQARHCADLAEVLGEGDGVVAEYLEQAIQFAEVAGNLAELGPLCVRVAEFKERTGCLEAAADYWIKAVRHSRARAIAAAATVVAEDLRRTYREAVARAFDLLSRLGRKFECVALAETAKSVFLSLDIQRGIPGAQPSGSDGTLRTRLEVLLAERERCTKRLLEKEFGPGGPPGLGVGGIPELDRVATLEQEIAAVQDEIAAADPRIGSWTRWGDVHDISPTELRALLGESGTVAIGAFSMGEEIRLYVVSAGDCFLCPMALRRSDAMEAVGLSQLEQGLRNLRETFPVFGWIEEHVGRLVKPDTRYIVVAPDDVLYGFPWGGLGAGGRPLIQDAPVVIAVGLDSVLTRDFPDGDPTSPGPCLVVSDPLAGSRQGLPGAAEETRLIVEKLGSSRVTALVGAQATVRAVAESARYSRMIHLACHGRFGGVGENSAELWLAPSEDDRTQTGVLTPAEIVRSLDLADCSLVNVSACGVGRLREKSGAGVDGVVSAFLIAGARNVVGSVFLLEDGAAAQFSGRFYEELVRGGSPAQALARTQVACWSGELGSGMQLPRCWAGYVVFCAAVR